jgi:hypothetical protein
MDRPGRAGGGLGRKECVGVGVRWGVRRPLRVSVDPTSGCEGVRREWLDRGRTADEEDESPTLDCSFD